MYNLLNFKTMKKLFIIAVVAFVATLTSCKKEWTCECCVDCGGGKICGQETKKETKKDAQERCDEGQVSSGGCTTTCELK